MKPRGGCQSSGKLVKVLLTLGLAIIMLGTVWSFTWAAQAGGDSPASAQEGWGVLDAASVGFTLTAKAEAPDGSVYDVSNPGDIVYNGDVLTYTISLCNENAVPIASVLVDDVLPENTLDNRTIACSDDCDMIGEGEYVPVPSGVTIWITITRQTRWTFASIGPGECVDMAVWGRVIGQSAGTWFGNTASTNVGGLDRYLSSEVGERPPSAGVGLPEFPSWLSDDFGGTIDQDWGDFDRDGDLDLVLGSSLGATVYVNEGGDLEAYWHAPYYTSEDDPRHAYGVRWADLDGDAEQRLELVVVGNSVDHALEGAGVNYIYAYNEAATQEEQRFTQTNVFTSSLQLVRVAPADYDGDGDIDLIASANAINAPCAVRLYRNDGTGNFIGEATRNVDGNVWYPCVSDATGEDATAALGPVDYDNDGDVDLAIGAFPSTLRLLINQRQGEVLTDTNPFTSTVVLETDLEYIPYGLAWGDYDLDGYLDLAAAYPLQRKVYVYHNEMGDLGQRVLVPVYTLRTVSFMEPLSVDWGDFDGDGWLDLAVADSRLAIFLYDQTDDEFVRADYLGRPASGGQVWSVRAVDLDNQGSLALVATNRDGFSRLFDAESSKLKSTMQQVELGQMESVAWGDWNGDGSVDLLFGSGSGASGARLYLNEEGTFPLHESLFAGFGPHAIAFGDITGDGELEIVVGKGSGLHIYDNDVPIGNPPVLFVSGDAISSLALGDFDDNEVLDVLVGRENGVIDLYLLSSSGGILSVFSLSNVVTGVGASVSDLAVGDYNGDHYLDFAAGFDGGGVHIYRNFGDSTFDLIWQSAGLPTRAVAWADYDGDNDPDLAVGNYGTDDYVWRNNSGAFSAVPIWTSTTTMTLTTSLAWGDWNNDGYPDLAVGKDGAPDVVYANLGSGADYLAMVQMWRSDESYATTDVAWGDRDGDGDLDLAISQGGIRGASGFYENTLAVPAHIAASEAEAGKLPAAPPYVYVDRPGDTCDAYLYSSSEILGNPGVAPLHVVTITYRLYDLQGDPVVSTGFEYSLDGEVWLPATPYPSSPPPITATNGVTGVFVWNAIADGAIGEYARFRVRVVTQEATGPLQRAVGVGVSPPFRVRAQNCVWPEVYLTATELSSPDPEQECYRFTVDYSANGQALFDWDLDGNGTYEIVGVNNAPRDQCYAKPLYYTSPAVRLRTLQCPGRPAFDRVLIGDSPPPPPDYDVYLPLVLGGGEVGILHDATTLSAPASSADKAWGGSVTSAAGGTAVDPGVTDHSTVRGSVGTTSKVTMFALGVNSQPAINSDGSRIAFWSTGEWTGQNPDGSIEIFVAAPGDFGRVTYAQVTSSTGSVLGGFSLSPSMDDAGERLVFFSDMDNGENGDRNFEIFMADISEVSSAGVSVTQVTHTPRGVNILPDISGDGTYIAFASDNDLTGDSVDQFPWGQLEIYRAEVVGKAITFQRVTTSTEEFAINDKPSISEDGRFIAFVSNQDVTGQHTNDDGNLEVFIAEVGPSGQVTYTQITDSAACVNDDPSINADGTSIAYLSDCIGGSYDVYLWRDGLDTLQITETDGDEDHPSISADGLRVAYIWDRRLYLYDVIEDEVIAPVASGPGSTGFNAYPVLSADGSNVAFNHDWDIYVARYPLADLALSKTVSNGSTDVAEIFTYTLTITNTGPSPAPGVVLTDVLPSGVEAAYSYAADQGDDSDLILDLHLDDNSFVDSSSYGNHASCPGGVDGNCPSIISGKVGQAARFNGSGEYDDFLRINPITSFPDAEITSMFWLRTSDTSRTGTPFSYAASGSWAGNEFWIFDPDSLDATINYPYFYTSINVADGLWHHVAVTWRSSDGYIRFYVDGELRATGKLRRGYKLQGGGSLVLGQDQDCVGGCFANSQSLWGDLDEVAVYRRALTDWEIYNIYVAQGGESNPDSYTSPVMAQPAGASGWSAISWMPSRPVGVDLPDYGGADPDGYLTGSVAMTGNVFLMHMNETAGFQGFLDTSGEGNDGYCDGALGECPVVGTSGKLGNALSFDGANDYVNVGAAGSLEMDDHVSIEAWIYPTDASGGIIVNKEGEYEVAVTGGTVQWAFANSSPGWAWVNTNSAVPLNQWTHVAVVYDVGLAGTGVVTTYVNGALVHTGVVTGSIGDVHTGYNDFRIGGRQNGTQFFTGRIDEVAIFDRALSEEEVLNHYLRGALKVEFEVRSCDDPLCSGETFGGPYPDHTDPTVSPPAFAINVPDNPYFQYRVTSTFAGGYMPGLQWVEVHPWVQCSSGSPVACTIGTPIAPLDTGESVSVVLPVIVPKTAVFSSSNGVLINTAIVDSLASDHEPINDEDEVQSLLHSDCWVRLNDEDVYFVNLQAAAEAAPEGATLRVAGTCGGVERRAGMVQTLYLSKTLTIRGGYTVTNGLAGPSDPAIYTTTLDAGGQGGGVIYVAGSIAPTFEGLHITGGSPISDSVGGGIHVVTATVTISGCRVYGNTALERGGGVYLENSDSILLNNNIISDNSANLFGGGIYLQNSDARFINNVIQANVGSEGGGGLYVIDSSFTMTNTVLATNQANNGGGLYVDGSNTQLYMLHTTIVGNVALDEDRVGDGIYVSHGSVILVNTIVANHERGIYLNNGSVEMEYTLWWANDPSEPTGDIASENDFLGNPLFVNAPASDYHIQPGSAAVGRGTPSGVAFDLDGHPRGSNPDIGAYESPYGVTVAKMSSSNIVKPGDTLTYTIYVTNTGYMPLTGLVLTDTLPSDGIDPSGVLTWTLGSLPAGDTWSPPPVVVVHISSVYTGVLTNTVSVSAAQLVTASADIQVTVSANAGDLPWTEDFDLRNGTTYDAGPTAWSTAGVVPGPWVEFSVQDKQFDSSNTDREGIWISGEIDISGVDSVDVSIDLMGAGGLNAGGGWKKEDYLRVYYKLDDGDEVEIVDIAGWCDGRLCIHDQGWTTVGLSGLSGDKIQIIVRTKTTADDEHYYWDNVKVYETPEISVSDVSVYEGNNGSASAVFTVSLSSASSFTVTVDYATADGTATVVDEDYTSIQTTTLTFLPGQTARTIPVTVHGDTKFEPNESFYVNLGNPSNATIGDGQGVGTITNDDSQPTISIEDVSVTEGNSGTRSMVFTVTLSNPSYLTVSVTYRTTNGTAVAPGDYTAVSTTTLTFSPGQTTRTIPVMVNGDTVIESDESFYVDLANPSNATISDGQGVGTILNDDFPSISINDRSLAEGHSGTRSMVFTVTLSSSSSQTVTVDYATADGTATVADGDYMADSNTLTFSPGQTTQTITITVNGDEKYELDESFYVDLDNADNATIGDGRGEGTITNDDPQPAVSINSMSWLTEGNTSTQSMVFTVTLSNPSSQTVTVDYATADGTATVVDEDYTSIQTTTLTFLPGQTTQTITITVNGDTKFEANESFYVNLANPSNATIVNGQGVGTITNDDSQPTISIEDVSVTEGNSGTTSSMVFTVTLSNPSYLTVSVTYSTTNGTAVAPGDYTAVSTTTLTFSPGQTTRTITITVNGDSAVEPNEVFYVNLANPTHATISDAQGAGTILNDDS